MLTDILAQPNISFSAHNDGASEAKQGLQVLMGSSFTICCSILPQYPGGSFELILTTSAMSQNYTLPAVNHSAHFLFSAADHTHQGDYRCVYHINVFSHNFSSESQPLHLTVSGNFTMNHVPPMGKCDTDYICRLSETDKKSQGANCMYVFVHIYKRNFCLTHIHEHMS